VVLPNLRFAGSAGGQPFEPEQALALAFAHPVRPGWDRNEPMKARIMDEDHDYDMFHGL
jgi:hypothetical protein